MKKMLSLLMMGALILSMLPLAAVAAEASWMWPVLGTSAANISQYYGANHDGLDIAAGSGTAVLASKSGRVERAYKGCCNFSGYGKVACTSIGCQPNAGTYAGYCNAGYGNGVVINHGDGTYSHYAHLSSVAVEWGQTVSQGQVIGAVGSSGMSYGPHLHFALAYSAGGSGNRFNSNPGNINYLGAASTQWYSGLTPVDLGTGFDARIIKTNGQMPVGVAPGGNVELVNFQTDQSDVWHFTRRPDGSYTLRNQRYGTMMDVANGNPSSGTNVGLCDQWKEDNKAQQWFIYGSNGSYELRTALSACVLDVFNNESTPGANVEIWNRNASDAQKFTITKVGTTEPDPQPPASVVVDPSMPQYTVGETNAVLSGRIDNPNGCTISTVGLYLYTGEGLPIGQHIETCDPAWANRTTVPMWFDLNKEAMLFLAPGRKYQYALYAYVDGVLCVSEKASFQTTGVMLGDVTGDGAVNASDALMALQSCVGLCVLNDAQQTAADVTGDHAVSVLDALEILQYYVGLIHSFSGAI